MNIVFPKTNRTPAEFDAHFSSLLAKDDTYLFTKGACHIFAQTLHEKFGYPLRYIPGHHGKGSISHIYAVISGVTDLAIDARGTLPEIEIDREFSGGMGQTIEISSFELLSLYSPPAELVLFAAPWFIEATRPRALKHISSYRSFFDGSVRERIPSQPA